MDLVFSFCGGIATFSITYIIIIKLMSGERYREIRRFRLLIYFLAVFTAPVSLALMKLWGTIDETMFVVGYISGIFLERILSLLSRAE